MAEQLSREDLKGMTPEAIVKAKQEGRLNAILGRPVTANQLLDSMEPKPND